MEDDWWYVGKIPHFNHVQKDNVAIPRQIEDVFFSSGIQAGQVPLFPLPPLLLASGHSSHFLLTLAKDGKNKDGEGRNL